MLIDNVMLQAIAARSKKHLYPTVYSKLQTSFKIVLNKNVLSAHVTLLH